MVILPEKSALILVAVMPSVKDLEIARLLGWYRIPLRFAPKVINVDFLAFYQTGAFGKDRHWQIASFAAVRGNELTTRAELIQGEPEHPRAKEEYYKIQLGPLQFLDQPIRSEKWRRVTFFYTTGEYFACAKNIHDLIVQPDQREVLWKSLKERAQSDQNYVLRDPDLKFDIEAELLTMLSGLNK
jgi:hypothetical protein